MTHVQLYNEWLWYSAVISKWRFFRHFFLDAIPRFGYQTFYNIFFFFNFFATSSFEPKTVNANNHRDKKEIVARPSHFPSLWREKKILSGSRRDAIVLFATIADKVQHETDIALILKITKKKMQIDDLHYIQNQRYTYLILVASFDWSHSSPQLKFAQKIFFNAFPMRQKKKRTMWIEWKCMAEWRLC